MTRSRGGILCGLVAAVLAGCGDDSGGPQAVEPTPSPAPSCVPDAAFASDTTAPVVTRVFPDPIQNHDRDGDGLIDLELAFEDGEGGSGVDPATVTLEGPGGRDLLETWAVAELSAARLVVEETIAGLLPSGADVPMTVTVSDRACNVGQTRIGVGLRAAALHRSIPLLANPPGLFPSRRAREVAMRPDGEVLFVVDETAELLMVDPNEYRLMARPSGALEDLRGVAFDAVRNRVYAVSFEHPGLAEFDGSTGAFLRLIPTTQGAFTLALSQRTGEVYIPLEIEFEAMNGVLSVVGRDAGEEVALVQSGITKRAADGTALGQQGAVLTEDEERLYVTTASDGVLVYDPQGREFVQQIDLRPDDDRLGAAGAVERVGDDLYVNVSRGLAIGSAVYRVDALTGTIEQIRSFGRGRGINTGAAASPDGTRLFVTAESGSRGNNGPDNYLLSLPTLTTLAELDGLEDAPDTFGYFGAAWHPDGKRVYVAGADFGGARRSEILVYLVRP